MPYDAAPAAAPSRRESPQAPALIPLPEEGIGSATWWRGQLQWSEETKADLLKSWRRHAEAYEDKLKPPRPDGVRVNIEFEKTEQKRHQLFYRLPSIKLRAAPRTIRDAGNPAGGLKKAIAIFREVLNQKLGPGHANLKPTMDELIFDLLCPAGIAACVTGYERHVDGQVPVETGEMIDDPNYTPPPPPPGTILDLRDAPPVPQVPETIMVDNVLDEQYYAARVSPAELIIPVLFRGSDYNKADFLGYSMEIARQEAQRRKWQLPESRGGSSSDEATLNSDRISALTRTADTKETIRCRVIFYWASRVDPNVKNPKKIRRLVFVDGVTDPVVHEDCRDQRFDDKGRLVGGIDKLPIKILTLRYVSDKPYPPSDCQITARQSDELAEFRTQQIIHRRKAAPRVWVNVNLVADAKVKQQILEGKHYDDIPVNGRGDDLTGEIARPSYPNENWRTNDAIMDDTNRLWALGANASAVSEGGGTTATEIAAIEKATATRLSGERERVSQFYIEIVEAFAQLLQLYADREDYVEIVGEDGARMIEAWDRQTIQGRYLFSAVPDSSMPPDAQADRDLALNRYNLIANDPYANREQLLRDTVEAFDGDPDRLVRVPDESQPKPEAPRLSLAISGKDMDPASPQYANVIAVLTGMGFEGLTAAAPTPQPAAGGGGDEPIGPADVVDRERLRMSEADIDNRAGGLIGVQ